MNGLVKGSQRGSILLLSLGLAVAAPPSDLSWEELKTQIRHEDPHFKALDSDGDGKLTDKQKIAYADQKLAELDKKVSDRALDVAQQAGALSHPENGRYTSEDIEKSKPPSPKGISRPLWGVQVTRKFDDVDPWLNDLNDKEYAARLSSKDPATISYFDSNDKGRGIQAQGVIARAFMPWKAPVSFVPAIEFDRLSSDKDGVAEVDSLRFRAALAYNTYDQPDPWKQFLFSASALYGTNFDFDRSAWQLESDLTGYMLGQGVFMDVGPLPLRMRYQVSLHGEYGDGLDDAKLKETDFARLGPRASLDLVPSFDESSPVSWLNSRLHFSTKYSYYFNLGDGFDYELLNTSLNWRLDQWGHAKLKLEYQYGYIPLTGTKTDTVSFGIGIIF